MTTDLMIVLAGYFSLSILLTAMAVKTQLPEIRKDGLDLKDILALLIFPFVGGLLITIVILYAIADYLRPRFIKLWKSLMSSSFVDFVKFTSKNISKLGEIKVIKSQKEREESRPFKIKEVIIDNDGGYWN